MSLFKSIPNIKRVVPVDFFELVIQFDNQECRLFSPGKQQLYDKYSFMAYPNKLRSYKYDNDSITWANGVRLSKSFFYDQSPAIDITGLQSKYLTVGCKNQAPNKVHPMHDEYSLSIVPFSYTKPFVLSESIGGGHAEMGGSLSFSLEELLQYNGWKEHIEKAGCGWVIDIIGQNQSDVGQIIDLIVEGVCGRSKFE